MEMEKKKRSHNGEVDGRRTRAKEGKGDLTTDQAEKETTGTATEEEVEEFFAILRRVHEVVRYFGKGKSGGGGGGGGEGEVKRGSGKGWNPSFQWEDFEDVPVKQYDAVVSDNNKDSKIKGRVVGEKRDVEAVEENLVLDLNAEPESLSDMN